MGGLRTAAAALCTRGTGADLEVLLAHRAPQLRFFGGYDAFPGGAVEPSDGREGEGDELDLATRRAVIREAFEEAGVLPVGADELLEPGTRAALRAGLLADDEDAVRSFQRALDRQPELLARARSTLVRLGAWLCSAGRPPPCRAALWCGLTPGRPGPGGRM